MRLLISILLCLLLIPAPASAARIDAVTCEQTDVQAAIDAANDGDIVNVPAGTCSWSGIVTIPNTKGITLQGAGDDKTIINVGGSNLFMSTSLSNSPVRVTGFRFNNIYDNVGFIQITGTAQNWRIDNNIFNDNGNSDAYDIRICDGGANVDCFTYGVIDNNQFINRNYATSIFVEWPRGDLDPVAAGDWIWNQPQELGTEQAVYIEDNVFSGDLQYSQVVDSRWGAKYVLRYNTIHNPWISTHSGCTNNGRDPMWTEIYKNILTDDANRHYQPMQMRSTSGIVWDNTASQPMDNFAMGIDHERSEVGCSGSYGAKCDGTASFDENSGSFGYRCLGQPGWGPPQPGNMDNPSFAGLFAWDNADAGSLVNMNIVGGGSTSNHVQFGREVFNEADMTIGLAVNRPSTCNPGPDGRDVYVSTDENAQGSTIYVCSATNTWTKHWEPYTYPHPLRVSGPTITCSSDLQCNDGNLCTDDVCSNPGLETSSCSNTNNADYCNDGDSCTSDDVCSTGSCTGSTITTCSMTSDGCCPSGCDDGNDVDCLPTQPDTCQSLYSCCSSCETGTAQPSYDGDCGSQVCCGTCYSPPQTGPTITVDSMYPGASTGHIDDEIIDAYGMFDSVWASAENADPHWVLMDFGQDTTFTSATIYWGYSDYVSTLLSSREVQVQSWDGSQYQTIATMTNSGENPVSTVTFSPVTTTRLRFYQPSNMGHATVPEVMTLTEIDYSSGAQHHHQADNNPQNGCILENELTAFIALWKQDSTTYPMREMMEAITLWKAGTGC